MWYQYYAIRMGIPRSEYPLIPFGEFADLLTCYRVEQGAARLKMPLDDEEIIGQWLGSRRGQKVKIIVPQKGRRSVWWSWPRKMRCWCSPRTGSASSGRSFAPSAP
mgnify:CR=1 FL=1